ncbi:ribosomal protein S18 acetylase RimI-like enzyme [Streptosporangium lutulentum]|uniref:Ribosomal protein S18 acetylase RimI-like enzyme n=1 Tax=Streptosporangium lutulentum TaxID=1461250 RepID=A0ABT9QAF4_9ACTN|nr:GNAT family N-acetyltransferase [Streptosporangium lutulentum]MDP9843049.1 ribosomal protein S18 acetylase RimI-like enzyme [Streptosporangium lutulentum]
MIDYTEEDFAETVRDVDLVIDSIGGDYGARSLRTLRDGGILVRLTSKPDEDLLRQAGERGIWAGCVLVEPDNAAPATIAEPATGRVRLGRLGFDRSAANRRPPPERVPGCRREIRMRRIGGVVCDGGMTIKTDRPGADGLGDVVRVLGEWQHDGGLVQLHPGDVGWFWRFGAEPTAEATRTWSRAGEVLAVGLLDGADLLRLAFAPQALQDEELARQVVEDVSAPERGVLLEGKAYVEAPMGALVQDLLLRGGWESGEPWTPLRRDLGAPVPDPGVRVEVIGPEQAHEWAAVLRASFDGSTFTDERWHAMAAGAPYADARCLVVRNEQGEAVAAVAVWSAGEGKPGLIEPMGVHRAHRRHGYGKAITVAAARALQELGSSSVDVCTPSSNVGAVATYRSAGLERLPERRDLYRSAS